MTCTNNFPRRDNTRQVQGPHSQSSDASAPAKTKVVQNQAITSLCYLAPYVLEVRLLNDNAKSMRCAVYNVGVKDGVMAATRCITIGCSWVLK